MCCCRNPCPFLILLRIPMTKIITETKDGILSVPDSLSPKSYISEYPIANGPFKWVVLITILCVCVVGLKSDASWSRLFLHFNYALQRRVLCSVQTEKGRLDDDQFDWCDDDGAVLQSERCCSRSSSVVICFPYWDSFYDLNIFSDFKANSVTDWFNDLRRWTHSSFSTSYPETTNWMGLGYYAGN